MLRTKFFENKCDVLIITRDVLIITRDVLIITCDILIIMCDVLITCDILIIMRDVLITRDVLIITHDVLIIMHDILIITHDELAYDDYVPECAKQLQRIMMSSLSGSAGQGPAASECDVYCTRLFICAGNWFSRLADNYVCGTRSRWSAYA